MTSKRQLEADARRKEKAVSALYKGVQNHVKANKGTVMVIGGIQLQEWPTAPKFSYSIAVKCVGQKPIFSTPSKERKQ